MTLTRHNEYMNAMRTTSTGITIIPYANNETAQVSKKRNTLFSFPDHSTAIKYWHYDPKTELLSVEYQNSNTLYQYEGVPFAAVFAMLTADSLGAYVAKEIKPKYSVKGVAS